MTAQPTYRPTPPSPTATRPTARARRRRTGGVVSIVAAVLVALAGLGAAALHLFGTRTIEPGSVQREIVRITQSAVGVAPADVRCPVGLEAQAGATFTCTATVEDEPVTYWVHQDDAEGHLTITSDRLLRLDAVEGAVAAEMAADLHVAVAADCGPSGRTVVANTPGQEIDCTAENSAAPSDVVEMTVTVDDDGTTAYRLV